MSQRDRTLGKLLELRQEDERKALKIWRDEEDKIARYISQIEQIKNYRLMYLDEFQSRGLQGMATSAMISYQSFIAKLDVVIDRQEEDLERLRANSHRLELIYLDKQKERKIIESLIEKHRLEAQRKELKAEQKLNDEFAMIAAHRKLRS